VTTYHDIQRETGLSLATISKYFNGGNVRAANRVAIEAAVQRLGFRVNEFARSLRTSRSMTVGVLLAELNSSFNTSIISRVEDLLRTHGYGTIICNANRSTAVERDAVEFLLGKMVDGIIAIPVAGAGTAYRPALDRGVPVVLIDRLVAGLDTDSVVVDNATAFDAAVEELLALGHERIALIAAGDEVYTHRERRRGVRELLERNGLAPAPEYLPIAGQEVTGGYEAAQTLLGLPRRPTAILCANYEMTLGAVMALNEAATRVPEEVSLIGFDNLMLTKVVKPRPTIVVQPVDEIVKASADLMLRRLAGSPATGPRLITLPTTLVRGESVGPPPGATS
jgi:LacI family transcriptional regulator